MPAKRSAMRKIKEVLRLKFEARLSHERIGAATGLSKGAVSKYVQRAISKSLSWPLPQDLDDTALERLLFPQVVQREHFVPADYAYVHQELKRKGGDAAAAVGGVPRRARGAGVSVQPVLLALPALPRQLGALDAPDPPGR